MDKSNSSHVVEILSKASPDLPVRVMVRPMQPTAKLKENAAVDPKRFKTSAEFRSKLIADQKARLKPGKEALMAKARELGLSASAAGSVNAVLVEGRPQKLIDLLKEGDIESVVFDRPISMDP